MRVLDPGYSYELRVYDQPKGDDEDELLVESLTFVKRNEPPDKYPGNINHYPGTQTQEVLRALIDRTKYVDKQKKDPNNKMCINLYRQAIYLLELRARKLRGQESFYWFDEIENIPTCDICGHILCLNHKQ